MKTEESILKVREILETKNEDIVLDKCVELIDVLAKTAAINHPNEVSNAFEDFFNYDTLN